MATLSNAREMNEHFPTTTVPTWNTNMTSHPFPGSPTKGSWYQEQQFPLYLLQVTVAFLGNLTNIINILIFMKIGLSDCVTISFFALAISDLLHLICFEIIRMLSILQYEQGISSSIVRLQDLGGWFGWLAVYFMDVSMYITVFATFQKCCCVVFPLKFKNVFTTKRSWVVIGLIFIVTLGIFMPVLFNILDKWLLDPDTRQKPLDWIRLNSGVEATVWRFLHRITLTILSQTIVILSLVVITAKLKKSVKFRTSNKAQKSDTISSTEKDKADDSSKIGSTKEMRAIRSVQVIALIFVLTTLPSTINSVASVVYPKLNMLPRYRFIVFTIQAIMYFGGTLNASVNMFVYISYNTKYKMTLFNYLFRSSSKTTKTSSSGGL